MPLVKRGSEQIVDENVSELLKAYVKKNRIGAVKPKSREHARRIALAITFGKEKNG